MKFKIFILIAVTLTIFSCKTTKFITSNDDYIKLGLDFTSNNITIIDERFYISQGQDIRLPLVSYPNQFRDFHPELNQDYKNVIKETIKENLDNTSVTNSTITVYVLEARKEFSATFSTEQELVSVKLKLVIDINGEKIEIIESGEFYRKSLDATYKSFEKLFQRSLKEVTYNSLKKINKWR